MVLIHREKHRRNEVMCVCVCVCVCAHVCVCVCVYGWGGVGELNFRQVEFEMLVEC